jgi:hypothetical protein
MQSYLNNVSGVQNLYVHNDRYLKAVKKSCAISYPTGTGFQVAEWSVSFVCGDPFYYSTESTCSATAVQSNLSTRVVQNTGTAPAPFQINLYSSLGTVTGLTVYQIYSGVTVAYFRYTGSLSTSTPGLVINSNDFTAVYSGAAVGTAFAGDFLTLRYTPTGGAANTFRFQSGSPGASVTAMILYTPRYF